MKNKFIFPPDFSKDKCFSLIGNSINIFCARQFMSECLTPSINSPQPTNIKFCDLFAGIGGFHLTLLGWGRCVLAVDNNKDCQKVYQLNFPTTPFLLGDINDKDIQTRIINADFDLLCAGFPCQPYSKANNSSAKKDTVITALLSIIQQKRPNDLFLENVPQLLNYPIWDKIKSQLSQWGYSLYYRLINPRELGIPMNRPRLFIWATINGLQPHYFFNRHVNK